MSDEAAFLRAITDRPADDAPRLVFADWLDDRGESGRAAFIRLSVFAQPADWLLPTLDPPCKKYGKPRCGACPRCEAFANAVELFRPEWAERDFARLASLVRVTAYARGFPVAVEVEADDWITHHAGFRNIVPLRSLSVVGLDTRSQWLRLRKRVQGLHISVEGNGIPNGLNLEGCRSASRQACAWARTPHPMRVNWVDILREAVAPVLA